MISLNQYVIDHNPVVKVKDILPGKSGYNLYLKVVKKNVLIDIVRIDKTRVVIADFIVGDETGIIKMRLRNGMYTLHRTIRRYNQRRRNYNNKEL